MLRQWADARLISGMAVGGGVAKTYGSECHDAIERALSMPEDQLRGMSIEQLYKIGQTYDTIKQSNANLDAAPESNVRGALAGWDVGRGLKFLWDKVSGFELTSLDDISAHFTAETLSIERMRARLPEQEFAPGSKERGIADNLGEALGRSRLAALPQPGR